MLVVLAFLLGVFSSLLLKHGINITIKNDLDVKEGQYNESLTKELPPEIQDYMNKNNGQYKF